jgi:hypothetical protein
MIFSNLGSLLIFQVVIWLLLAFCKVIIALGNKSLKKYKAGRFVTKIYQNFWWNGQINFWRQNYLAICVTGLI